MHENIVLLIGGERADLPDNFDVLYNLKMEELTNPTVVKNSYSKTVALPGTKNNNRIFGFFFRSDREAFAPLVQGTGAGFDASKRIDFEIYVNASLEESGYLQLNDVTRDGISYVYNCTFYGGLGDFLYTLTKNEKGNPLLLADLDWGIDGAIDPETEMDFSITKEAVASAWTYLNANSYEGTSLWDTINFAPLNEGVPDGDFDADKVLINTMEQNVFPTSGSGETSAFTTYHNYALGTLDGNYDWLATRDLRSYHQRPVFKIKRFFDAISNPENNGNYTVELDPSFFCKENPYFADAYCTLPALGTGDNSEEIYQGLPFYYTFLNVEVGDSLNRYDMRRVIPLNGPDLVTDSNGNLDISNYAFGTIESYVDMQLTATTEYTGEKGQSTSGIYNFEWHSNIFNPYFIADEYYSVYFAQLVMYDANTNDVIEGSDIYCFGTPFLTLLPETIHSQQQIWAREYASIPAEEIANKCGYHPDINKPYAVVEGAFYYDPSKGCSVFRDNNGFDEWRVLLKAPKSCNNVRFEFHLTKVSGGYRVKYNTGSHTNILGPDDGGYKDWDNAKALVFVRNEPYFPEDIQYNNSKTGIDVDSPGGALTLYNVPTSYSSGARITKQKLLSLDVTPADVLLSYCKMFGLVLEKNKYERTVSIRLKNTHYTGEIVDLSSKIDYSKPFNITPLVLTSRYYNMQQDTPETYYTKKYLDSYGTQFGSQKINTSSNFDNNITELYEGNVFSNLVTARAVSRYNANFFDRYDNPVPSYLYNGMEMELYENGDVEKTTSIEMKNVIDFVRTQNWFKYASLYDFMDRPISFTLDGGEKKNVESKLTLLFFNGMESCLTGDGDPIRFWLTDDINEMMELNDGRCWIWTNTTIGYGGTIALEVPRLPIFSRYSKGDNPVSFDFGTPREIYVLNSTYGDTNIYKQYWQKFLTDQFNVNTRMVSCYVKLNKTMYKDCLRKFYYFDNALWMLNEVQDYSLTKDGVTKCVFIKVQDTANYTDGQVAYTPDEE